MIIYQIKEGTVDLKLYGKIVFSTCRINPLDEIDRIEKELKGYVGIVLFDLLLCNGINSNRFMEAFYDGMGFSHSTFKEVEIFDEEVKLFTSEFYYEHQEYLTNSILPPFHQYCIKKKKLFLLERFIKFKNIK